jgi:hypothetical protein
LKLSKNNTFFNNNASQVVLEQRNMTLVKSNSVNSLNTQNRTFIRQNTEYRNFIPRQNSTVLSPNFNKNVVFGNRRVNVTFGSPNMLRNEVQGSRVTTF